MKKIKISNNRFVGLDEKPYFIGEIGINHNGDYNTACKLIDMASNVGIDCVKLQKRDYENTIISEYLNKSYNHQNSFGTTYRKHKQALEFTETQLIELAKYSNSKNITLVFSAFDINSYSFIENKISPLFYKIASPQTVNHELLKHVANFGKPMFISTGMTTYNEISKMIDIVKPINEKIVLLQCTSLYPTENKEVHLRVIEQYQRDFNVLVGFSSHDRSIVFPSVSLALGACVIEKHITLDRTMAGPDHSSSFEKRGLELCYNYLLNTHSALGNGNKEIQDREINIRKKHMQSIVTNCTIKQGAIIKEKYITYKSPGTGFLPYEKDKVIGKKTRKELQPDTIINNNDIE